MADKELLPVFQDAKETLCKYDYYIHTSKRILHLTNTEEKIPHLMGLQYIGAEKFTGDSCEFLIKKGRLKRKSIEAMTTKLYRQTGLSIRSCVILPMISPPVLISGLIQPHHNLTTQPFSVEKYYCNTKNLACMELWVLPLPYPKENETWEFTQVTILSLLMTSIFTPPIWINTLMPFFRFQK